MLGTAYNGGNVSVVNSNLPFSSKYPGYVCFVVSYLSVILQCRIFDEVVGKIVIRKASLIIPSNKFDFHGLNNILSNAAAVSGSIRNLLH